MSILARKPFAIRRRACLASLLVLVQASCMENLRAAQPLSIDDVVAMRRLQAVQIAPDGEHVAYVVEVPRDEQHSKLPALSQLWIVPSSGGQPTLLTQADSRDSSPLWSPDGRTLAYLSSRASSVSSQIHRVNADGSSDRRLSDHPEPIQSFSWSPDGGRIVFVAAANESLDQADQERLDLGYDAFEVEPSQTVQRARRSAAWTLDVETRAARRLETGAEHVLGAAWSPDGTRILLTLAPDAYADDTQLRPRLATVGLEGGTPTLYGATRGKLANVAWSPDAKAIAYLGSTVEDTDFFPNGLFVCRHDTPRDVVALSAFAVEKFRWSPDAQSILAVAMQDCHRSLARIDVATGKATQVTTHDWEVAWRSDFSVSRDGRIACVLAQSTLPPDIWLIEAGGQMKQLTHLNPDLADRSLAKGEVVHWHAPDGLEISGVLIRAPDCQPDERCPLIVQLHGSNMGDANDFHATAVHWGQLLAAQGYAVLLPNYRGSLTGSVKFRRGARGDFGGQDLQDILSGVDALVQRGIADPERLAVCGISYGGYLTARAITQTARFKAAAMASGISDWFAIHGAQTGAPEAAIRLEWEQSPYQAHDLIWDRSPIAHVDQVQTPLLIIWGENDFIPISQAVELHRGLRTFNATSQLVVYPREGHVLSEPNHLRDQFRRMVAWFDKYVRGTESR